jgi:hypothetical protein
MTAMEVGRARRALVLEAAGPTPPPRTDVAVISHSDNVFRQHIHATNALDRRFGGPDDDAAAALRGWMPAS